MGKIDTATLEELLAQHGGALTLYARQWCPAAEDVVQDVFLRLVQQHPAPDNPTGWLYRAVRNRAIDIARREGRRQRHEYTAVQYREPWFKPTNGTGLDAEAATQALESLPSDQREVVVARLWGGLSYEDIAKLTHTSSSTAARRYQSGLTLMRERLRVRCEEKKNSRPS